MSKTAREHTGQKYRPSNGTAGEGFMEQFCYQCIHEKWSHTQNDADKKCDILSRTLYLDLKDEGYPTEWQYDENDRPTCTAYKHWDWGNNRDGLKEPPPPPVDDPNQLVMPFILDEICKNETGVELDGEVIHEFPGCIGITRKEK